MVLRVVQKQWKCMLRPQEGGERGGRSHLTGRQEPSDSPKGLAGSRVKTRPLALAWHATCAGPFPLGLI